jgi:hypothetical protein
MHLTKMPGEGTQTRQSYYAMVSTAALGPENTLIDELIGFAFEELGAWRLDVRIYDETSHHPEAASRAISSAVPQIENPVEGRAERAKLAHVVSHEARMRGDRLLRLGNRTGILIGSQNLVTVRGEAERMAAGSAAEVE